MKEVSNCITGRVTRPELRARRTHHRYTGSRPFWSHIENNEITVVSETHFSNHRVTSSGRVFLNFIRLNKLTHD